MTIDDADFNWLIHALDSDNRLDALYHEAVLLAEQGKTQPAIYHLFERLLTHVQATYHESEVDNIYDVMDCIVGWCAPHQRIFQEEERRGCQP